MENLSNLDTTILNRTQGQRCLFRLLKSLPSTVRDLNRGERKTGLFVDF